jgi:hypothetical protein
VARRQADCVVVLDHVSRELGKEGQEILTRRAAEDLDS